MLFFFFYAWASCSHWAYAEEYQLSSSSASRGLPVKCDAAIRTCGREAFGLASLRKPLRTPNCFLGLGVGGHAELGVD